MTSVRKSWPLGNMGGEILGGYAKTDAKGNFTIRHQFPNLLHVDIQPTIWLKTKLDGKWLDQVRSTIDAPTTDDVVNLEIGATRTPRFKYFGHLLDAESKPMAIAKVEIGVSSNPDPHLQTWFDGHNFVQTSTKPDGSYEIMSPTPWVHWITPSIRDIDNIPRRPRDNEFLPPGKYDLSY